MYRRIFIGSFVAVLVALLVGEIRRSDEYRWPNSAHERIENMASILRSIEGPARWCDPSVNPLNLMNKIDRSKDILGQCISGLQPVSDYEEIYNNEYIRRFYRATFDDALFCEVTLSTVWNDDRIVGSDCYYGLFERSDDPGVGLTADPFG